jgi:hypothetical protein
MDDTWWIKEPVLLGSGDRNRSRTLKAPSPRGGIRRGGVERRRTSVARTTRTRLPDDTNPTSGRHEPDFKSIARGGGANARPRLAGVFAGRPRDRGWSRRKS